MSSASQIAVAKDFSACWDAPAVVRAPGGPLNRRPPGDPYDTFSGGALDAAQASSPTCVLAKVWKDLARGRLRAWCESATGDWIHLVARLNCTHPSLSPDDSSVPVPVLCAQPQKVVAAEF